MVSVIEPEQTLKDCIHICQCYRDKTMDYKFIYNDDEQNWPYCKLKWVVKKFEQYMFGSINQISIKGPKFWAIE